METHEFTLRAFVPEVSLVEQMAYYLRELKIHLVGEKEFWEMVEEENLAALTTEFSDKGYRTFVDFYTTRLLTAVDVIKLAEFLADSFDTDVAVGDMTAAEEYLSERFLVVSRTGLIASAMATQDEDFFDTELTGETVSIDSFLGAI